VIERLVGLNERRPASEVRGEPKSAQAAPRAAPGVNKTSAQKRQR
jgi:hypothetical protein